MSVNSIYLSEQEFVPIFMPKTYKTTTKINSVKLMSDIGHSGGGYFYQDGGITIPAQAEIDILGRAPTPGAYRPIYLLNTGSFYYNVSGESTNKFWINESGYQQIVQNSIEEGNIDLTSSTNYN